MILLPLQELRSLTGAADSVVWVVGRPNVDVVTLTSVDDYGVVGCDGVVFDGGRGE